MVVTGLLFNMLLAVFLTLGTLPEACLQGVPPILTVYKNASVDIKITTTMATTSAEMTTSANLTNTEKKLMNLKFETAQMTRYIEIAGYASSLLATSVAIYIFSVFSGLNNKRTFIHKNLCWAIFLESAIRLLIYSDQLIVRNIEQLEANIKRGIENVPYLCESMYVIVEYTRLEGYIWMFIEGLFVSSLVSSNALQAQIPIIYVCMAGWLVPAVIVGIWASVAANHYSGDAVKFCWYGYNYLPSYYIVQGPILIIVVVNYSFLIYIMRVIVKKLRRTYDSELVTMKKSVRAALILMPLLGIGNVFGLFDYPLDGNPVGFAIWSYLTHFLRSFQGFFIALLYCFTNREVIKAVQRKYFEIKVSRQRRRKQMSRTPRLQFTPERPVFNVIDEYIPMTTLPRRSQDRASQTHDVIIEAEAEPPYEPARQRATSLPIYCPPGSVLIPGFEQFSPVRLPRHIYSSNRQFTRPGLVTRESQRQKARAFSSCI